MTKWAIFAGFLFLSLFATPTAVAEASVSYGTIDQTHRYAWGENIGWVDFGSSTDTVNVTDSALTGSVYGENVGWIVLNPVGYGGVSNDAEGNLSGYAWGENIGWVDFSQVRIGVDGIFSGQAYGENIGWITFGTTTNKVATDWRPFSSRQNISGTLYESDGVTPYITPTTVTVAVATATTVATFSTTTEVTTGNFNFNFSLAGVATGTPITLFTNDSVLIKAVTVTKSSGTSTINDLNLTKDNVTIRNEGTATTTKVSDLSHYDSTDDSDIQFTASTSLQRFTVSDGQTLRVAPDTTFHLDWPIVGDNFIIATSASVIASSSLTISGDFTQNGTFVTADTSSSAWTARSAAGDDDYWFDITYGNGLFVAVGFGPDPVMTSPNGITWTPRSAAGNNDFWQSITYGNGLFVAVGNFGDDRVMTSPDGITWATSSAAGNDDDWSEVIYGNGLFVAVASFGGTDRVMTSPDGITWTPRSAAGDDDNWYDITYGNGLFVAVGNFGDDRVMTSPDGITWTPRSAAGNNDEWLGVTYGNGLFVAVATNGIDRVMTSPDGITWTPRSAAGNNDEWLGVTYGNGLFVAVATNGIDRVMTSPDGINWTPRSAAGNDDPWTAITYANNTFVAVSGGGNNRVMTSTELPFFTLDGITAQTLSGSMVATSTLPNMLFSNGGTKTFNDNASTSDIIITTSSGAVSALTNLSIKGNFENNTTFSAPTNLDFFGTTQTATGTMSGLTNLYINGTGEKTFYTPVTTTNLTVTSIFNAPPALIISGDYTNNGISNYSGGEWAPRSTAGNNDAWSGITYGNGMFVAVGYFGNRVITSPDGITWTPRSATGDDDIWRSVTYANGLFVAVGNSGDRVITSPDGITWTARSAAGNDDHWYDITYGNGLFVAVGNGPDRVMTSPDGINWTARSAAGNDDAWSGITYGNGLFVSVANSGTDRVMTSPDGITWTPRSAAGNNDSWYGITYGNGLFVAVGEGSDPDRVMTSPDGITWTPRSAAGNDDNWYGITYGNGLFVAVANGGDNRVMTSPDGIAWTPRSAAGNDDEWLGITYGNGLFVAVANGGNNRVMTSLGWGMTTFGGASAQTLAGNMTGASALGNVTLTGAGIKTFNNTASTSNLYVNTTATTTFTETLDVRDGLTAQAGAKLALAEGATTTVSGKLTFSGSSDAPVLLVSETTGQSANLVLFGSSSIKYTRLKDSNACGSVGGEINVASRNNTDDGNISCWNFFAYNPVLSLLDNQQFYVGQATTSLGTLTIIDAGVPVIKAATDIRITIATTTTNFRFDTSTTNLSYTGSASSKVSNTVSYEDGGATLLLNVTSDFAATDTLAIADIMVGSFASFSTTTSNLKLNVDGDSVGAIAEDFMTVRITSKLAVTDHSAGQTSNKFNFQNKNDATLFAFNLGMVGENATITNMVISLSGVDGVDSTNLRDFKLYRDNNSNGVLDGGDDLLDATGALAINGQNGTITFGNDILVSTSSKNYIMTGDIVGMVGNKSIYLKLETSEISVLPGTISLYLPFIEATVSDINHTRYSSSGGGSSARIGDDAPPGDGDVGGGGAGGGGGADVPVEGQNILPDANYFRPTTTGTPDNEWTNGSNGLISDGVYATSGIGNKQSYTGFSFNIPATNTIKGIKVKVDLSKGQFGSGSFNIYLSSDNGNSYTMLKSISSTQESDIIYTLGGEADTWGRSWTSGDFAPGNFLVQIYPTDPGSTYKLDALEVRVFHQAGGGGAGGGGRI